MVKLDNMTVTEALKFRVFKIPFTNIELDSIEMYYLFNTIGIILLIIIVLIVLKYKKII